MDKMLLVEELSDFHLAQRSVECFKCPFVVYRNEVTHENAQSSASGFLAKYRLLSAKPDGSDEKVLHIQPMTYLPRWLAWSPDGKNIVYPDVLPGMFGGISQFDLDSGKNTNANLCR